jgi:hypothetical protein
VLSERSEQDELEESHERSTNDLPNVVYRPAEGAFLFIELFKDEVTNHLLTPRDADRRRIKCPICFSLSLRRGNSQCEITGSIIA